MAPSHVKVHDKQAGKAAKVTKVVKVAKVVTEEEESNEELQEKVPEKLCMAVSVKRVHPIEDGSPRCTSDAGLFWLEQAVLQAREQVFMCPTVHKVAVLSVLWSKIQETEFKKLIGEEQLWYLSCLLEDFISCFSVNFPVLFNCSRIEILCMCLTLLEDSSVGSVVLLMDSLCTAEEANDLAAFMSPKLSAANNSALMVVATIHENLSMAKEVGWWKEFERQIQEMCVHSSTLEFSTID